MSGVTLRRQPSRSLLVTALAAGMGWAACGDAPPDPVTGPPPEASAARRGPPQELDLGPAVTAKERHGPAFMSRAGVVGAGVGLASDGSPAVIVFTLRRGLVSLPAHVDGVPVVEEATGMFVAGQTTTRTRPAPNGYSIGHPDITAGTLGALVTDGSTVYLLSNNHVMAASNSADPGDPILQPGPVDGGSDPADRIALLADFATIDFSGADNTIDAAIAGILDPADVSGSTPAGAYGAPGTSPVSASVGMDVQKFGRTTELTTGDVAETNVTVDVCYRPRGPFNCARLARFVDQFTVAPGSFSDGGDSGSLIVTDNASKNPVGLLFAGSSTRTIANPIQAVLQHFGVSVTTDPGEGGGDPTNDPPTAGFTASPTSGEAPLTVTFDASASSDPNGDPLTYSWEFGDGNNGSGETTSHTYQSAGEFTAVLTVSDGSSSDTDSQLISVTAPPGGGINLSVSGSKIRGVTTAELSWSGATSANIDVFRDGALVATTPNDGAHTDEIGRGGGSSHAYQVCETGTSTCSSTVTVSF